MYLPVSVVVLSSVSKFIRKIPNTIKISNTTAVILIAMPDFEFATKSLLVIYVEWTLLSDACPSVLTSTVKDFLLVVLRHIPVNLFLAGIFPVDPFGIIDVKIFLKDLAWYSVLHEITLLPSLASETVSHSVSSQRP